MREALSIPSFDGDFRSENPTLGPVSDSGTVVLEKLARQESEDILREAIRAADSRGLGRAAARELVEKTMRALLWAENYYDPDRGPFGRFAIRMAERANLEFFGAYSAKELRREAEDDRRRDAARESDVGLVEYLEYWARRLRAFQARRQFSYYPGLGRDSEAAREEFCRSAELELIERVRGEHGGFSPCERPGVEATYVVLSRHREWLKRRRKIHQVAPPADVQLATTRTPEDIVAEYEEYRPAPEVVFRAYRHLRPSQAEWLSAFQDEVRENGLKPSGGVNLASAARKLGKSRSAALRAVGPIRRALTQAASEIPPGSEAAEPIEPSLCWTVSYVEAFPPEEEEDILFLRSVEDS